MIRTKPSQRKLKRTKMNEIQKSRNTILLNHVISYHSCCDINKLKTLPESRLLAMCHPFDRTYLTEVVGIRNYW